VLRLPIAADLTAHQAFTLMRTSGVRTIAAVPRGGQDPDAVNWRGTVGLLLGGEGPGLTDEAIALCDARVTIPMAGGVESLNVAAAGAILVYAARRQRA
jgi:TrmH family RNA methyltransferase